MRIVTAGEMRALDREVIEGVGVPGVVLMELAGRGVVEVLSELTDLARTRFVVFAGPGNNGGDGFVVARHLANREAAVEVVLCASRQRLAGDALTHFEACRRSGVEILDGAEGLSKILERISAADVVIDALLGTGLQRQVEGHFAEVIGAMNAHPGLKVAVDIPSGLDSDRGIPLGVCVRADRTVTFGVAKLGLVTAPGFVYAGQLHVTDIGIPQRLVRTQGIQAELLEESILDPLRAGRDPLSHKGTHGHVLLVAGSPGKSGAALLSGAAALRSGAGLVTLAVPETLRPSLDGRRPELMTVGYGPRDPEAAFDPGSVLVELKRALQGKSALGIGPGMPTDPSFATILEALIKSAIDQSVGVVLDADGLNHLARAPGILEGRSLAGALVLTPHPGEAARLLGRPTKEVQADRVGSARAIASRFSAVVALKGARTVVAAPDGHIAICPTGNPGMGTGGTGDVLTGCVAARLAAGRTPFEAAAEAVYLHGAAGDRAAAEVGERGLCASDLIAALPSVMRTS